MKTILLSVLIVLTLGMNMAVADVITFEPITSLSDLNHMAVTVAGFGGYWDEGFSAHSPGELGYWASIGASMDPSGMVHFGASSGVNNSEACWTPNCQVGASLGGVFLDGSNIGIAFDLSTFEGSNLLYFAGIGPPLSDNHYQAISVVIGSGYFGMDFLVEVDKTNRPVPIPGAVWLLGSGLIVLMGFRKKLKK